MNNDVVDVEVADELPELLGEVLALAVWFLFGAVLVPVAFDNFDLAIVVYALLSLTVVRMLPVALALVGAGLDRQTVLFMGWFGPRGLASVVFALLAVEELGETSYVVPAIGAVSFTVLLSVVLPRSLGRSLRQSLRAFSSMTTRPRARPRDRVAAENRRFPDGGSVPGSGGTSGPLVVAAWAVTTGGRRS